MRKRLVFVLVVLAAFGSIAGADCIVRQRAIVQTAVVAPVVTPVVTPLAVPLYGASYDNSAVELAKLQQDFAALQSRVVLLESARDTLVARLAIVENKAGILNPQPMPRADEVVPPKGQQPAKPQAAQPPAVGKLPALFSRSCIQCHNAKKADGGLVLVRDGKLALLKSEEKLEVIKRINLTEDSPKIMPPRKTGHGKVSDEEAAEVLSLLVGD